MEPERGLTTKNLRKKYSYLAPSALVLLLSASLVFSQQPVLVQTDNDSEASVTADAGTYDPAVAQLSSLTHDAKYGIELFPGRGGKLDWGLALSGGGIRSAAFNLGAMKALYDKGMMEDIDVISSVSGGGYASYWLFTNYAQNANTKFGDLAFGDGRFIENACNLQNMDKSNPVPNSKFLAIIWKVLWEGKEHGFKDYKRAIELSFRNKKTVLKDERDESREESLSFLNQEITKGHAPYFIINATLALSGGDIKDARLKEESSKVFEISPHFRGNPTLGFSNWKAGDEEDTSLSKAIAMSGAPQIIGPLGIGSTIRNFNRNAVAGSNLYLSDGGHSENLAALALIRREIKNIIIVDAASAPKYKFHDYTSFRRCLRR